MVGFSYKSILKNVILSKFNFIINSADGDLPKATNTSALSGAGVKRFFNKFGETVNKMKFKMDESEPVCFIICLLLRASYTEDFLVAVGCSQ